MNIEGYWYSKHSPEYPMPIPDQLADDDAAKIYNLIRDKEKNATITSYRGCSVSQITGQMLGNSEYDLNGWIWPADFAPHYVLTHKVKPSDEFLEFIGYCK